MKNLSLVMLAMALAVGCGDDPVPADSDSGTTPDGGGDTDGGGTNEDGGGADEDGGGTDEDGGGGGDDGGTTPTLDCASYCTTIMANCSGTNAQYISLEACMGTCAGIGDLGTLEDTDGNTLGCRIYHAAAAVGAEAETHCPHAGPLGGNTCGEPRDSFCDIVTSVCATAYPPGGGPANCSNSCADYTQGDYSASPPSASGDTLACRMYHLTVASQSATDAVTHCPHTSELSPGGCM